jgi:hypothetical protein
MNLESKKQHILRCIKLGMDLYRACIVATCTPAEIELIESDERFSDMVDAQLAMAEYDLLEMHDIAMRNAAQEGKTTAIQWKLGKLNPKWENKEKDLNIRTPEVVTVILKGKKSNGSADS